MPDGFVQWFWSSVSFASVPMDVQVRRVVVAGLPSTRNFKLKRTRGQGVRVGVCSAVGGFS